MSRHSTAGTVVAVLFNLFLCLHTISETADAADPGIQWEHLLSNETFSRAKAEKRLVILDLEAVWCHWCHVMEKETYSRPEIISLIDKNFIPARVDQDARPDLSNLYRDYGWPATIIFNAEGEELRKLSGFVEPKEMERILTETIKDPRPMKEEQISFSVQSALTPDLKDDLTRNYQRAWDRKLGGLKTNHKYLDPDTIEFALRKSMKGDKSDEEVLKLSLENNRQLFDPIWGGVYQYSTYQGWSHPHFERIVEKQADNIRLYSLAHAVWPDANYLAAVDDVFRYLTGFLTDASGAFYTSQDADLVKGEHSEEYYALGDLERRKRGIPTIDKNIYSSENGRIIAALAVAYSSSADEKYLRAATAAGDWIVAHRQLPEGGFAHGDKKNDGPYLVDSLHFGRGALALYSVTADRKWLKVAEGAGKFIASNFSAGNGLPGYLPSKTTAGGIQLTPQLAENITTARFFNALRHYTGNAEFQKSAENAMRLLATRNVVTQTITEVGVLIADEEVNSPPLHLTVVGPKDDPIAKQLFQAALRYPDTYKRTEWSDKREGPMPNPDVQYPTLPKPAAFVCTNKRCSLPIFAAAQVSTTIQALSRSSGK